LRAIPLWGFIGEMDVRAMFDAIYATDLTYGKDCWTLCGDAHCCSFGRYRARDPVQQDLLLLPHEHDYMKARGHTAQYRSYRFHSRSYVLTDATLRFEMLSVATTRGGCPCSHAIRPTVCRLYPMLPLFEVGVGLVGIEPYFALEDEVERAAGMPVTCRIEHLTPAELKGFLRIANAIASVPDCMFHVMAYDCVRRHVRAGLQRRAAQDPIAPTTEAVSRTLATLGVDLLRGCLFDGTQLRHELDALARSFVDRYGADFQTRPADAAP
jgi:hypothetical protein